MTGGHIELERAVSSIIIGHRHRSDLGDLDSLAASIERDGLLQPPTITPDGVLVCGRRRLAAIEQLGWRTVNVWVRSGISDRLGHLLAEQDDNMLHKALTPLEAAALYRELKALLAEDAARRQEATRFSSDYQPGSDGRGILPSPSTPPGETRRQAAAMIPGAAAYRTLDKIEFIQQAATRDDLTAATQEQIATALAKIEDGAPVNPLYEQVRALAGDGPGVDDAALDAMAKEALARTKTKTTKRTRTQTPVTAGPAVWTTRSFLVIWGELEDWWTHYDPVQLAADLSDEQIEMFLSVASGTSEFAGALTTARGTTGDEQESGVVRHLHAL